MFRIAVCDDTAQHSEALARRLHAYSAEIGVQTEIDCFESFAELKKTIIADINAYRLIVLEATVGGADGVTFACDLRNCGYESDFVFYTCDSTKALAAYNAYPVCYILKPAIRNELRDALRFLARRNAKKPTIILNSAERKQIGFNVDDIIYVEVFRTELGIHDSHGETTCTGSLSETFEKLPKRQFYRSHRSFVVNLKRVVGAEKYKFAMDNGSFVPIAKNRYVEARKAWHDFCTSAAEPHV